MNRRRLGSLASLFVLILLVMAGCGGSKGSTGSQPGNSAGGTAGTEAPFYEGKTITLIVPNSPGKGMDTYARMIVPALKQYTGAKDIQVKNITGAGGVVGVNQLWTSKPDGLTIAFTSVPTLILAQLSGGEGVQFDATKFTYLGRTSTEPRVLAVGGKSAIKSMDDVVKLGRPFKFPTQGTDEDFFTMAVLAKALNFQMQAITGYEGNADTALAVVKGEGDGHITGLTDAGAMIQAGDKRPILMISSERAPEYKDVPTAVEVTSGEGRKTVQAIVHMLELHRSFFGPPDMDPKAVAALRDAVAKALQDGTVQAKAKEMQLPIVFMDGAKEQEMVSQIAEAGQAIVPILKDAVQAIK